MTYLDLTHPLTQNIPVYPGDPVPQIVQNNNVTRDGFTSHTITVGTHVGTHIDAPAHMIENGKTINDYACDHFIGNGICIDARRYTTIDIDLLEDISINKGDVVLLYTGRDKIFNSPEYFTKYPPISERFAQKLVELKIKMIGMDQASPDYSPFVVHRLLLKNDVLIIENLINLNELINKSFTVIALPLLGTFDASPSRVIAHLE